MRVWIYLLGGVFSLVMLLISLSKGDPEMIGSWLIAIGGACCAVFEIVRNTK